MTGIPRIRAGSRLEVSALGIGTGTYGFGYQSRQSLRTPADLGALLRLAHSRGITWWDTSDDYGTHPHVREGLRGLPRGAVQISSKTHAATAGAARHSLALALEELDVAYLDLYLLHDMDDLRDLAVRRPAFDALCQAREQGLVRALGLSTHSIDVLDACVSLAGLDVVMTNFNRYEDHMDAGLAHYVRALEAHHAAGRGVLAMKAIGEGRLAQVAAESLRWNLTRPYIHAVLVGMTGEAEVKRNAAVAAEVFEGSDVGR